MTTSNDEGVVAAAREVVRTFPSQAFKNALRKTADEQLRVHATDNMAVKRVRPWEYCDSVQELKRMLSVKDEELRRIVTEKDDQLAELDRKLKSAKNDVTSSPAAAAGADILLPPLPSKQHQTQVQSSGGQSSRRS